MQYRPLSASTAIVLFLAAGPALAITPDEVWTAWKAQTEAAGGTLTVESEAKSADGLELTGLSIRQNNAGVEVVTSLEKVVLADNGDGSVTLTMPDSFPITLTEEGHEAAFLEVVVDQPGGSLTASGTVEATNLAFDYPSMTAVLTAPENAATGETVQGVVHLTEIVGEYVISPQDAGPSGFDYHYAFGGLTAEVKGSNAQRNENFVLTVGLGASTLAGKGALPLAMMGLPSPEMAPPDLNSLLGEGLAMDGTATLGALTATLAGVDQSGAVNGSVAFSSADIGINLSREAIDYGFGFKDLKLAGEVAASGMPAMDASLGELAFRVAMPVVKTDAPADFSLLTRLVDLQMSETLWGLFDPAAELARDPATFVLDLKGKGAWTYDVFAAPAGGMSQAPEVPVLLERLDLTQALLRIVGGEVDAKGALTFDHAAPPSANMAPFGGHPAPEGKINVDLKGINMLLEKAVAMGLIPESDLMGMRMGLAMFTRPGSAPDTLVSEIEFKNGGLFVNGQQLQ